MNFNEALELMKQGRKVKNTEWVKEGWLYLRKPSLFGTHALLKCTYSIEYGFGLKDEQSECWEEVL
jgi:hypothetical protein